MFLARGLRNIRVLARLVGDLKVRWKRHGHKGRLVWETKWRGEGRGTYGKRAEVRKNLRVVQRGDDGAGNFEDSVGDVGKF